LFGGGSGMVAPPPHHRNHHRLLAGVGPSAHIAMRAHATSTTVLGIHALNALGMSPPVSSSGAASVVAANGHGNGNGSPAPPPLSGSTGSGGLVGIPFSKVTLKAGGDGGGGGGSTAGSPSLQLPITAALRTPRS
jgi:hypothetical protein